MIGAVCEVSANDRTVQQPGPGGYLELAGAVGVY